MHTLLPIEKVRQVSGKTRSPGRRGMRILKVTQATYPFLERGGPAVKVASIAKGLAKRGHEVTILTADLGITNLENSVHAQASPLGWRIEENKVESIYLKSWFRYRALTANPGVISFCRRHLARFDVVHIYGFYDLLGPAVALFCRRQGKPYVVEPIGI